MSINFKINVVSKKEKITFPCIMKAKGKNKYVLFQYSGYGTVLFNDTVPDNNQLFQTAGYSTNNWIMSNFIPFDGEIILSNKKD